MAFFPLCWSCRKLTGAGVEGSGSRLGGSIGPVCLQLVQLCSYGNHVQCHSHSIITWPSSRPSILNYSFSMHYLCCCFLATRALLNFFEVVLKCCFSALLVGTTPCNLIEKLDRKINILFLTDILIVNYFLYLNTLSQKDS